MFICKRNEYKEWNDKNKAFEYETYPPRCKHCEAEYLANAYTYDKSSIILHYVERYYNTDYNRDVTATDFSSATTIMEVKLFMFQYVEKDPVSMKLTYDGRIIEGDEKTLGECMVPRKADIYVGDMTESDRKALAEAAGKAAGDNEGDKVATAPKSGTSNVSDVGFGQTKCFQNMN